MKEILCLCLVAVSIKTQAAELNPQPSESFPHLVEMDNEGLFRLYWKVNETYITIEGPQLVEAREEKRPLEWAIEHFQAGTIKTVHGNTSGWVGVGFSPNGGMAGSDIYVAWVKDGVARITDRHGMDRNGFPPKDNEQNVELLYGRECEGWTIIKFRRQIPSCEESFDWTLTTDTTRVIWAMGSSDPEGNDVTVADYHGSTMEDRGSRSLLLLQPSSRDYSEDKTESFDLLNGQLKIPPVDTYHNCRLFKVPQFSSKRHLIRVKPVIEESNLAYVHHIIVYQCAFDQPEDDSVVGPNHECDTPDTPDDFRRCLNIYIGWTIGAGTFGSEEIWILPMSPKIGMSPPVGGETWPWWPTSNWLKTNVAQSSKLAPLAVNVER